MSYGKRAKALRRSWDKKFLASFRGWLDACARRHERGFEVSADLYASWKGWAERAGEFVGTQKRFSQTMQECGYVPKRQGGNGRHGFLGIILADKEERTPQMHDTGDAFSQWLEKCTCNQPNHNEPSSALFASWKAWARASGQPVGLICEFYKEMKRRGYVQTLKKERRHYAGIKVTNGSVEAMMPTDQGEPEAKPKSERDAQRLAFMVLEESFDVAAGRYKDKTLTDESVAGLFDINIDVLKRVREEFFGPLKVPTEFADIEAEVRALEAALDDVTRLAFDLNKRIEATREKNGWK